MLSVLVVALDAMPYVRSAIEQAERCRTDLGAEVIAVDGGSTDGTWEALESRTGWTTVRQGRPGLAAARNEALALSAGSFVAFLDTDDEWLDGKTTSQVQALSDDVDLDLVACHLRKVGSAGDGSVHPGWTPSGCMMRRRVFDAVGPFDEGLRIACDHDWFMRARRAGVSRRLLDDCLVDKHIHERNLSSRRDEYRAELLRVLRRHG